MRQRIKIITVLLLLSVLFGIALYTAFFGKDPHERARDQSIDALVKLFDTYEHGEVITTSKNPEQAAYAVNKKLGKYFTDSYADKIEGKVSRAMENDRDFEKDPARITFFLVNKGNGFEFSKPVGIKHGIWLTYGDKIEGTELWVDLPPDDPSWEDSNGTSATVIMMKDGRKFKVDEVKD